MAEVSAFLFRASFHSFVSHTLKWNFMSFYCQSLSKIIRTLSTFNVKHVCGAPCNAMIFGHSFFFLLLPSLLVLYFFFLFALHVGWLCFRLSGFNSWHSLKIFCGRTWPWIIVKFHNAHFFHWFTWLTTFVVPDFYAPASLVFFFF